MKQINLNITNRQEQFLTTERPSELIQIALEDLELAESQKNVKVDMSLWYVIGTYGTCHVCLAGSVMKNTLGDRTEQIQSRIAGGFYATCIGASPYTFTDDNTVNRLLFLNNLRELIEDNNSSNTFSEIARMVSQRQDSQQMSSILREEIRKAHRPVEYSCDPEEFKSALRTAIKVLQEYDL